MITLTRLNSKPFGINSDLIKFVEHAPDTVLTLINGEKVIVRESMDEVVSRIVEFRRSIIAGLPSAGTDVNVAAVVAHPLAEAGSQEKKGISRG